MSRRSHVEKDEIRTLAVTLDVVDDSKLVIECILRTSGSDGMLFEPLEV